MTAGKGLVRTSAIDTMEEAVRLLKTHPSGLMAYYIGSLPFVLGLFYFWIDMSTGANAWQHCAQGALGLTLLFVWMKTWQAVYVRGLLARIRGEVPGVWSVRRILRATAIQAAIQPWGILILPVALVIMIPFPQAFAFFQNATLMGSGDEPDMGRVIKKAWAQASLRPGQNILFIWLASPFLVVLAAFFLFVLLPVMLSSNLDAAGLPFFLALGLAMIPLCPLGIVVAINVGLSLLLIPWLLRTLLGIETVFSMGSAIVMNDASLALICGLVYLCLDPLLKASYCLRCFYGEALLSGEDLSIAIRALRKPAALFAIFLAIFPGCASCGYALPEEAVQAPSANVRAVPAQELDEAIGRVMDHPQYTWRMPREKPLSAPGSQGVLASLVASVIKALQAAWHYVEKGLLRLWKWLSDALSRMMPQPQEEARESHWTFFSRALIIGPLVALMGIVAILWCRAGRQRRKRALSAEAPYRTLPDITQPDVDAGALPEDGWLDMAREMAQAGELRLALRALFLATLAFLARQDLIVLAPHKSDREYERELKLHSLAHPRLLSVFEENRMVFERVWYGRYEVTPPIIERFSQNQESIRTYGQK